MSVACRSKKAPLCKGSLWADEGIGPYKDS